MRKILLGILFLSSVWLAADVTYGPASGVPPIIWGPVDTAILQAPGGLVFNDGTTITSGAGGGGEANTASNLGSGSGLFSSKSGVDLRFKSLVGGTSIALTSGTGSVTITSTGAKADLSNISGTTIPVNVNPASNEVQQLGEEDKGWLSVFTKQIERYYPGPAEYDNLVFEDNFKLTYYSFGAAPFRMGNNQKIENLGTPTDGTDAATKQYVDDNFAATFNNDGGNGVEVTAAGGLIIDSGESRQIWAIKSPGGGGGITITADPQITAGTTLGQTLIVIGQNDSDSVTFSNGTGIRTNGPITLGLDVAITFMWSRDPSANFYWAELSRR